MKVIQSQFIVKGYRDGNCYYITQNENENYNVYQILHELNKDATAKDIKNIFPSFKKLPDADVIVSIPNERCNAFLLMHDVNIIKMNRFRITLNDEKLVV
ncbi:hypothetical protein [Bacillus cereus]|uniref:Uncharacterized protein n=1 Tax=Bacillus cereus TaxID=1396 RepID=A0A9X6VGA4_BACCE|nr:hypothetical protein [Bacillus cereus]PFD16700.1 hypothetical protein CN263_26390 [Bacillus cereus]PFW60451.1 hypothetical protein COL27_31175 [Bacillus sp. AFS075960]